MTPYTRTFGSGPRGLFISLAFLVLADSIDRKFPMEAVLPTDALRWTALGVGFAGLIALLGWSLVSLPPNRRGHELCTKGAFKYVRHPLYAAFLSYFNFWFALFLGAPVYLLWAVALHPLWHWVVRSEEDLMLGKFGDQYREYASRTGRFFPRLVARDSR